MRMLETLVHTAFARALSDALLHFLWEGAAAALLLVVCLCLLRSARHRYAAACIVLLALPVAFAITLWRSLPAAEPSTSVPVAPISAPASILSRSSLPAIPPSADPWTSRLPWLTPFWMLGVLCLYGRSLGSWTVAQRLRRVGVCAAPPQWQDQLQRLQQRLRISRPVLLLESCLTEVPLVIGFFRPVILAPLGFLSGFPAEQVEAFLIHELAHIRRADYLVNLVQTLVEGLLFYHPAVWWISSVVRTEREHCCDDVVVAITGDAPGYAAALAALEEKRTVPMQAALAATGGSLMKRVQRLLGGQPRAVASPVVGLLLVSACLGLAAWTPAPQKPAPAAPLRPLPISPPPAPVLAQAQSKAPGGIGTGRGPDTPPADLIRNPNVLQENLNRLFEQISRQLSRSDLDQLAQAQAQLAQSQAAVDAVAGSKRMQEIEATLRQLDGLVRVQQLEVNRRSVEQVNHDAAIAAQTLRTAEALLRQMQQMRLAMQLETPYRKWLQEDVAYIITDRERTAFQTLQTDQEREQFIEQFWLRRDPTPGTPENEFKTEHYRRIAYANQHFGFENTPGWKTDRGRIYIEFGPPDEREEHPSVDATNAFPFDVWLYRHIDNIGNNVKMEFVDESKTGEYRMARDPNETNPVAPRQVLADPPLPK